MSDSHGAAARPPAPLHVLGSGRSPAPAHLAAADLGARLSGLSAAARRVRRSQDTEAVHDLRVASRRLTADIDLWRPLLDPKGARRARRRARRMRRDLAALRDLEVVCLLVRQRVSSGSAEERAVLEALLRDAEARLDIERRSAPRVASRRRVRRVRRALAQALSAGVVATPPPDPIELADAHVDAMRERASLALESAWASGDDRALHAARIRVKRWRYAIECRAALSAPAEPREPAAEPAAPRAERDLLRRLRLLQDALGHVQDLSLLRDRLESAARRAALHSRPEEASALQGVIARLAPARKLAAGEAQRLSTTLSGGAGVRD